LQVRWLVKSEGVAAGLAVSGVVGAYFGSGFALPQAWKWSSYAPASAVIRYAVPSVMHGRGRMELPSLPILDCHRRGSLLEGAAAVGQGDRPPCLLPLISFLAGKDSAMLMEHPSIKDFQCRGSMRQ
jgi:hypothetical protein